MSDPPLYFEAILGRACPYKHSIAPPILWWGTGVIVLRSVSPLSRKNTKPHEVLLCEALCFGVFAAKEVLTDGNTLLHHCLWRLKP